MDRTPRETYDTDIMKFVMPRLYRPTPFAEAIMSLEIFDGPYTGVVFSYKGFSVGVIDSAAPDGMVPVKFDTTVHVAPAGFEKDEAFDLFTREILLVWLNYVQMNDIVSMIKSPTDGNVH